MIAQKFSRDEICDESHGQEVTIMNLISFGNCMVENKNALIYNWFLPRKPEDLYQASDEEYTDMTTQFET